MYLSRYAHRFPLLYLGALLLLSLAGCGGGSAGGGNPGVTEQSGGPTYVKSYSVDGADFFPRDSDVAADGSQYHLGVLERTRPGAEPGTLEGYNEVVLMRTFANGDVQWARGYGAEDPTVGVLRKVIAASETRDGEIWVLGSRRGDEDVRVLKLNAAGETLLQRDYESEEAPLEPVDIAASPEGGFALVAIREAATTNSRPAVGGDLYLLKADAQGQQQFLVINDTPENNAEEPTGVLVDAGGEIDVFGARRSSRYSDDFWLARFNNNGTLAFSETHTGITVRGKALAAVSIPRTPTSIVDRPGLLGVGYSVEPSLLGHSSSDPRLTHVHLPDGEVAQDSDMDVEDVAVANGTKSSYSGVALGPDASRLVAVGAHMVCPPRGCERDERSRISNGLREGFVQVLRKLQSDSDYEPERLVAALQLGMPSGTTFNDLALAGDGHYLVAASSGSHNYVLKLQRDTLAVLWTFDAGARHNDPDIELTQTRDGGALVVAIDSLRRLGPDGSVRWTRTFTPPSSRNVQALQVLALQGGGAAVLANEFSTTPGALLLQYAADGTLRSVRRYADLASRGLTEIDRNGDGSQDGFLLVAGDDAENGALRLRLSGNGDVIDALRLRGSPVPEDQLPTRLGARIFVPVSGGAWWFDGAGNSENRWYGGSQLLHPTADGGAVTLESGLAVGTSTVVQRLGADGVALWAKQLNVFDGDTESILHLSLDGFAAADDGGVILSGFTTRLRDATCTSAQGCGDGAVGKLDANGNLLWVQSYGAARGESFRHSPAALPDNGLLASGATNSFAYPARSFYAVRVDADGAVAPGCIALPTSPLRASVSDARPGAFIVAPAETDAVEVPQPADLDTNVGEALNVVTARACSGFSQAPVLVVQVQGSGTVASQPAGINCPSDCEQTYATDTALRLVAAPATGQAFLGWSGDCANAGTLTGVDIAMNENRSCTARFGAATASGYTLTVTMTGSNSLLNNRVVSSPAGIDCNSGATGACTASFGAGVQTRLTVSLGAGSRFEGWTGCDTIETGTSPACVVRDSGGPNRTVDARFAAVPASGGEITVTLDESSGSTGNRVLSSPVGIDCASGQTGTCLATFVGAPTISLVALPAPNQVLLEWSGCYAVDPQPNDAPPICRVDDVGEDRAIVAHFVQIGPYQLSVEVTQPAGASGNRVVSAPEGIDCVTHATGGPMGSCVTTTPGTVDVELRAEIATGSAFEAWDGCDALAPVGENLPPACIVRNNGGDRTVRLRIADATGLTAETMRSVTVEASP